MYVYITFNNVNNNNNGNKILNVHMYTYIFKSIHACF